MARKVLIQIRRGLEKDIGTLEVGELGFCTDTSKLYIGTVTGNTLLVATQTVGDMLKSIYDTNNNGKVDKAEVADSVAWAGVTGKPSTFAPSTHSHTKAQISDFPTSLPASGGRADTATRFLQVDTRATNENPQYYMSGGNGVRYEFKTNTTIGLKAVFSEVPTYSEVSTYTSWADYSGGFPFQLAVNNAGMYYRIGTGTTTWGDWGRVARISDIPTKLSQLTDDSSFISKGATWNDLKGV